MRRFAILPRLLPIDDGMVFVYGDRALIFGNVYLSQSFISRMGLRVIEHARNPVPTLLSLVIFDSESANYVASAQICKDGDRGLMYTINGRDFYAALQTALPAIMAEADVSSLEGYVVPSHTRLMTRELRKVVDVRVDGKGEMAGREMDWVVVRAA